ncbi:MAG: SDR family NAD(P)-dependent oxidoreductase, partial [Deinococcota bacterium]
MPSALVTGSAKGIGKALLLMLAGQGYDVAVHYNHSQAEAETVCDEAKMQGVRAEIFQADVTKPDEATSLVTQVHDTFGRLDVLINNVGNYHKTTVLAYFLNNPVLAFRGGATQIALRFVISSSERS